MSKLFVFGIGGTGARVLKSLTMLLASGVKINSDKIVPILIDPDTENGDMTRTVEILKTYEEIYKVLGKGRESGFFNTEISTLSSLSDDKLVGINNTFNMNLGNTINKKFKDFIEYNQLETDTKYLMDMLYSEENLESPLSHGFLGNPNVGSIVLNHLKNTSEFDFFGSVFAAGDRVFIISSIFGGTGAAGFPLILKLLRSNDSELGASAAIRSSKIGAVTVLPYFKLQNDDDSQVSSDIFITKTKAALSYYNNNITNINALYYLGDDLSKCKSYQNNDGGSKQTNNAHLIELVAALSIIDFAGRTDLELADPNFYEYAILENKELVDFDTLGDKTKKLIAKQLSELFYFSKMNLNYINDESKCKFDQVWAKQNGIGKEFRNNSVMFKTVLDFCSKYFEQWLEELQKNERKFSPFDLNADINDLKTSIRNRTLKKKSLLHLTSGLDYSDFDQALNGTKPTTSFSTDQKYMEMWKKAAKEVVENKFPNL